MAKSNKVKELEKEIVDLRDLVEDNFKVIAKLQSHIKKFSQR